MSELQPMSRTDSDRPSNDLHDADDSLEPRATHGYALLIIGINRGPRGPPSRRRRRTVKASETSSQAPALPSIDNMISNGAFWAVHSPHQDALHQLADHDDVIAAMRTEIVDMERRLQQMKTDLDTKQSQRDSLANHAAQLQGVLEAL